MKKQKITLGSILEIQLQDGYLGYAQILNGGCAFFDYHSKKRPDSFDFLYDAPILFILKVYDSTITKGKWLKVGKIPIKEELQVLPFKFIQDSLNPNLFELYNPNTGEITPATKSQCIGLEPAAVWEAEHVESRLNDFYNGVENIWVKQLAIQ
ncbi:immunity 26/phosphotriesterase HocA family protein [Flavobacterium sp.]|uniref:immunity 26/phosphotriesterase HocA family protein n=1 Tax=Flavobacterium sp. TaxID=239 RepID=UPI0039E4D323